MASIRTKLKELRNVDVRFISLVDRAASRIPFRVLKRDGKENDMGIDLARVFKGGTQKPVVADIVVFAQKNDAVSQAVRQSIADAGFVVDKVRKSDEDTVCYAQGPQTGGAVTLIRLSDQVVVSVRDMPEQTGFVAAEQATLGFLPGMDVVLDALNTGLVEAVTKEDRSGIPELMSSFRSYVESLEHLPYQVFKVDEEITALVRNAQKADEDAETAEAAEVARKAEEARVAEEALKAEEAKIAGDGMKDSGDVCKECGEKIMVKKDGTRVCKCSAMKVDDPLAAVVEEEKVDPPAVVQKTDFTEILAAITASEARTQAMVTAVAVKVDGVVQKQADGEKRLDEVVKKSETLEGTLRTTVLAAPRQGDRPAGGEPVKKVDEDPRSGVFDTAFLPGRRPGR